MAFTPSNPNLITYNLSPGPDLNSASETATPNFTFPPPSKPIILLKTPNPLAVCLHIKKWLLAQHEQSDFSAPGVLRMEHLELEKMARGVDGTVIVAPQVATLRTSLLDKSDEEGTLHVSILALLLKHEPRVRWFYTLKPITPLLTHLDAHSLLTPRALLEPKGPKTGPRFARLHTWLREAFTTAIRIPHSPDWTHAQGISDFCPSILDPETASARLEAETALTRPAAAESTTATAPTDATTLHPSDDRYLAHLHSAERELAALAKLKCAEYLFTKRNFFRAFWEEVYRSEKIADIAAPPSTSNPVRSRQIDTAAAAEARQDTPLSSTASTPAPEEARRGRAVGFDRTRRARVRTERAHQAWLEQAYKLRPTQARALVVGWRVLGFLDERRYVKWVAEGWGAHEDDESEGEGGG